jgi:XrtN system VIT domain protein
MKTTFTSSQSFGVTSATAPDLVAPLAFQRPQFGDYLTLALSFGLFLLPDWIESTNRVGGVIMLNYIIAVGFLIRLLLIKAVRFWSLPVEYLPHRLIGAMLWLISCFSLNREMTVFQDSVVWLQAYLLVVGVGCVSVGFWKTIGQDGRSMLTFLLAAGWVLYVYFAFILLPLYLIGSIGILFLGLGIHMFIPFILAVSVGRLLRKIYQKDASLRPALYVGMGFPLAFTAYFLIFWTSEVRKFEQLTAEATASKTNQLPVWVQVAQQADDFWITERILKTPIVYMEGNWSSFDNLGRNTDLNDRQLHDPLVVISSWLVGVAKMEKEDQLRLLDVLHDARHGTEERLWSGRNLTTTTIKTDARIWPEYRLAYTEKTLTIANSSQQSWRNEEALYSFYLPEGAVVTSMSLWVNGKERTSLLTTPTKADSAYRTIVGVEARDPAVVHWREGQTVRLRVFPCTSKEPRTVKIGYTSPLRQEGNRLFYRNAYFKGPRAGDEYVSVQFSNTDSEAEFPIGFVRDQNGVFRPSDWYSPDWEISVKAIPISNEGFTFDGHTYVLKPEESFNVNSFKYESFDYEVVYLDINSAWDESMWEQLLRYLSHDKPIFAYDNGWVRVREDNQRQLYQKLTQKHFSLLPFSLIPNPDKALVITHSTPRSLLLSDLKETGFAAGLTAYSRRNQPVRVIDLSEQASPYWRTLRELRLVRYKQNNLEMLGELFLMHKIFPTELPDNEVKLNNYTKIVRLDSIQAIGKAPDHLFRLFTYHHLMRQAGPAYFQKIEPSDALVREAEKAHVVTPFSSLIVLETEADYKRFDLKAAQNALDNASLKKSGAVPEPHEWAILILVGLAVAWTVWKQRLL